MRATSTDTIATPEKPSNPAIIANTKNAITNCIMRTPFLTISVTLPIRVLFSFLKIQALQKPRL